MRNILGTWTSESKTAIGVSKTEKRVERSTIKKELMERQEYLKNWDFSGNIKGELMRTKHLGRIKI
jgi:hypothetical protein